MKNDIKTFDPIRTALFVPGNQPDRIDKAIRTQADAVIIDLEDAVPLTQKEQARHIVREKLLQYIDKRVMVRINALDSTFLQADLEEVIVEGLSCAVVPKVESAAHIESIDTLLREQEGKKGLRPGSVKIIPIIESAMAIENAFRIASAKPEFDRIFTLAFGAADFGADMGLQISKTGEELFYPRARLAIACRAGGIEPPLDTPYMIDLKDFDALEADIQRAKQLGFQGKLCIHPNQLEIANRMFSPTENEIQFARKVIRVFEEAEAKGTGAIQLEGKFIDYPVVERSKRILRLANAIER